MTQERSNDPDNNELIETIEIERFDDILNALPIEIEINSSPILISFGLITLLALTGGSFWFYTLSQDIIVLACAIFFALFLLAMLYLLIIKKRPSSLLVSEEGFLVPSNTQSEPTPWKDFEYFDLVTAHYLKLAVFQHTKESGRKRTLGGYALPYCKDMPPLALVAILDSCREYFTTGKKPEDLEVDETSV